MVLTRGDAEVAQWPLVGRIRPDLAVVDEVARLQLMARRQGCSIRLRGACRELVELLDLFGLSEIVTNVDHHRPAGSPQMASRSVSREVSCPTIRSPETCVRAKMGSPMTLPADADDIPGRIRPQRQITGMSAVLLPYTPERTIDWSAFEAHIGRTASAGLTPAVNMDTGYVQLLDERTKRRVLDLTAEVTSRDFVAGAFVDDRSGSAFDLGAYASAAAAVAERGGTPVIFPSHGLNELGEDDWVDALASIGRNLNRFIGFELGSMFVPCGRIFSLRAFRAMMEIPQCIGAKHSSLSRSAEWDRLSARDEVRPGFKVFTGNDLAIDMVMYGSDYLLGLSTFAPEAFAARDRLWSAGDPAFFELNDLLQYLGQFAFRHPVPGYRHDAAMFLEMRGWATSDVTPPGVPRRPESDRAVLADIAQRLPPSR